MFWRLENTGANDQPNDRKRNHPRPSGCQTAAALWSWTRLDSSQDQGVGKGRGAVVTRKRNQAPAPSAGCCRGGCGMVQTKAQTASRLQLRLVQTWTDLENVNTGRGQHCQGRAGRNQPIKSHRRRSIRCSTFRCHCIRRNRRRVPCIHPSPNSSGSLIGSGQ